MSLEIPYSVKVLTDEPLDFKYLNGKVAFASLTEANTIIPIGIRSPYLTIVVAGVEYWWKDGAWVVKLPDLSNKADLVGGKVPASQLPDDIQITIGEEFYYDENDLLRPNISTYRQVELNNTSPIPLITLDFEPTFIQSVNVNGVMLTQNQYIYTAPNQLDLSDYVPSITPMTIEIIYDHFITTNIPL